MYLKPDGFSAPVVDFLNGAVVIVNKAMLTKLVPENELGKLHRLHSNEPAY